MDAKDFRLGNWVTEIENSKPFKIKGITYDMNYWWFYMDNEEEDVVTIDHTEPITLTSEILQKYLLVKGLNNKKYEINDWFEIAEFEGKFYLSVNCEYLTDTEIIYVHELQNLYYILTQKELIIQL